MAHVKDFPQARIVAEEFGMPILSSSASAAQRKAFVASVKGRLAMVLHEFEAADRDPPHPPHRVWTDGGMAVVTDARSASQYRSLMTSPTTCLGVDAPTVRSRTWLLDSSWSAVFKPV